MKTRNDFGLLAQEHYKTGMGVEVGTQYGYFAKEIAKNWKGKIHCVDIWQEPDVYKKAKEVLRGTAITHKGTSKEMVGEFKDGILDWVYIDADHHYDHVKEDINIWYPKVRRGGIVAGHDYCRYGGMEVIDAVDEFIKENGYKINLTTDDYWQGESFPTWWFIKR